MTVMLEGGKVASENAIRAVEAALGFSLSPQFRAFVQKHDGAEPENNRLCIEGGEEISVRFFVSIDEILKDLSFMRDVPRLAYPVAFDDCGNYVIQDQGRGGKLYFWDHEAPWALREIADSFDQFLAALEPDNEPVVLKPGQVKSVWVDPDFLNEIDPRYLVHPPPARKTKG